MMARRKISNRRRQIVLATKGFVCVILYLGFCTLLMLASARRNYLVTEFWAKYPLNMLKGAGEILLFVAAFGLIAFVVSFGINQVYQAVIKRSPVSERVLVATGAALFVPFAAFSLFIGGGLLWTCMVELGTLTGMLSAETAARVSIGDGGGDSPHAIWIRAAIGLSMLATWIFVYYRVKRKQRAAILDGIKPVIVSSDSVGASLPANIAAAVKRASNG